MELTSGYAFGLTETVTAYRTSMQASGVSTSTQRQRCRLLGLLGEHPTRADVERVIAPVSLPAKRVYVAQLRSAYADLEHLGMWSGPDPTAGLRLPRAHLPDPRPLTGDQVARLEAVLEGRAAAWTILGLYAGLRASEAAAWTPEHLVDTIHGPGLLVAGKGNKTAIIPAHPKVQALGSWPAQPWTIQGNYLSSAWRVAAVRAGLPDSVRFHQLRHTYGTGWAARTGDLLLTRDLLRHASVATTQRYTRAADDRLFAAMRTATGERPVNDYPMAVRELQRSAGA